MKICLYIYYYLYNLKYVDELLATENELCKDYFP